MRRALYLAFVLLAGCATTAPPPSPVIAAFQPPPLPLQDTCGATAQAALLGQRANALERVLILRPVRLLRGTSAPVPATMPTRINFVIGADEAIVAITCG